MIMLCTCGSSLYPTQGQDLYCLSRLYFLSRNLFLYCGRAPFPTSGFDINLSPLEDSYIIESGSPKEEAILEQCAQLLDFVSDTQIQARDKKRLDLSTQITNQAAQKGLKPVQDFQAAIQKTSESDL
jgi:hypothetical protein